MALCAGNLIVSSRIPDTLAANSWGLGEDGNPGQYAGTVQDTVVIPGEGLVVSTLALLSPIPVLFVAPLYALAVFSCQQAWLGFRQMVHVVLMRPWGFPF